MKENPLKHYTVPKIADDEMCQIRYIIEFKDHAYINLKPKAVGQDCKEFSYQFEREFFPSKLMSKYYNLEPKRRFYKDLTIDQQKEVKACYSLGERHRVNFKVVNKQNRLEVILETCKAFVENDFKLLLLTHDSDSLKQILKHQYNGFSLNYNNSFNEDTVVDANSIKNKHYLDRILDYKSVFVGTSKLVYNKIISELLKPFEC
jgi:hypothetical protein